MNDETEQPMLSSEAQERWLSQEAAWQCARIKNLEDRNERDLKQHNCWIAHINATNRTNLIASVALVVMCLVVVVFAVAVAARLP